MRCLYSRKKGFWDPSKMAITRAPLLKKCSRKKCLAELTGTLATVHFASLMLESSPSKGACRRGRIRYITLLGQSVGSGVFETHFASQPHFPPRFLLVFDPLFSFGISLCLGNRSVRSGLKHILPPSYIFSPQFFALKTAENRSTDR